MKANSVVLKRGLVVLVILVMLLALLSTAVFAAFRPPGPAAERADYLIGFEGAPNPGLVRAFEGEIYAEFTIVDVIAARMTRQQAAALQRHPAVSYIEPDGIVYAIGQTVPWGIDRVFNVDFKGGVYDASSRTDTWDITKGQGIGVAVLDTGIDLNHEDLQVAGGRRFYISGLRLRSDNNYNDVHGHGTHVAGTIAALDNSLGVVGVAPEADLYAVKVLTDSGSGSVSAIVAGIEWVVAQKNIQIINMSLGSSSYSQTFKDACDKANAAGVLVISSAGNSGNSGGTGDNVGYPARYASVIAVAASDNNDNRGWFSSTGPTVELIAPGVSVLSTVPGGYATYNGTSMASPHVAGVAALVWAADRDLSNTQVRGILNDTAEDLKLPSNHQGSGLVRADLAVGGGEPPVVPTCTLSVDVNPAGAGSVTGAGTYDEGETVTITALAGDGWQFVTWSGDSGTIADVRASSTTIIMNGSYSITANFEPIPPVQHTLVLASTAGGSVTVPGEGSFTYPDQAVVDLLAVPEQGYEFDGWTGDVGSIEDVNNAQAAIIMDADKTVIANFKAAGEPEDPDKPAKLEVTVNTDKAFYTYNSWAYITVTVGDEQNEAVQGAAVSVTVWNPKGGVAAGFEGFTVSGGTVTFNYRVMNKSPEGSYSVEAVATKGAVSDTGSATFTVNRK